MMLNQFGTKRLPSPVRDHGPSSPDKKEHMCIPLPSTHTHTHTHSHTHALTHVVWGWGEGLAALDPAEDRLRALFSPPTPSALLTGSPIPLTKYKPALVIFALS